MSTLTCSTMDRSVALMLWTTAERRPDHPAVVERGGGVNYRGLRDRAASIGSHLNRVGLCPGDRVAIFLERGADAAAAFFGVAAAGGIAVIMNETLRPRQIEHILGHAGARILIASADLLARQPRALDTTAARVLTGDIPATAGFAPVNRVGQDVAQIIYTSGSTGQPKGVTLTHANLWAGARSVITYLGVTEDDRLASLLPFSFDYGFNQLLCTVLSGATLAVERSPVPQQIVASLRSLQVTILAGVPPLWLQLLAASSFRSELPHLRAMTNSGGRLPVEAVRTLRQSHPAAKLFLMYGLTEAFRSTYLPPDEADAHPDSIGEAIPGAEILVVRDDGTSCEPGEVGELVHRGPTVALGYWNDPDASAKVFRPHPLRPAGAPDAERVVYSGDLVRRDRDGWLYHVGRRDHMIKTLGYRVSPDEVAEALYGSGQVVEAVVGSEPDPERGERIVAYVVLKPEGTLGHLEEFCRAELPRYMQPSRILVRAELPRTSSGKHDVRAAAGRP
jgi:amino acid adenylation domain-containing protein